jgi:hypothetical protein
MLQQKKSQKGNWESLSSSRTCLCKTPRYNKRNPKKGIESELLV